MCIGGPCKFHLYFDLTEGYSYIFVFNIFVFGKFTPVFNFIFLLDKARVEVDIMSDAAMENAYFICHSVQVGASVHFYIYRM
jgi:hypothetical protein